MCCAVTSDDSQRSIDGYVKSKGEKSYTVGSHDQVRKTTSVIENIIVGCGMPLSVVENIHFINFCKDMDPMFHLPSRSYLSRQLLPNAVSRKITAVHNHLQSAGFMSMTIDIWTDRRCHSFLAATIHTFVRCEAMSVLLSFVSFKGSHTGQRIAAEIDQIVQQNQPKGKVVAIVTDNASNMKRAVDIFKALAIVSDDVGNEQDIASSSDENADDTTSLDDVTVWQDLDTADEQLVHDAIANCCTSRLACFAHTLQLTVRDGLDKLSSGKGQNMKTVMGKCVKLASLCHQSAKFREAFEEKMGVGRSIPAANATRWNSTYTQLHAIASFDRNKLEELLLSTEQSHLIITVRDFAMLKELLDILEPFAEATDLTQGEKYATIGCVTPCIIGLYNCLVRLQQSCKYHGALVRQLMDSLQSRFGGLLTNVGILDEPNNEGFVNVLYLMASLLDPNYGFVWLENDLQVSVAVKDALQHKIIDAIIREAESVCTCPPSTADSPGRLK